MRPLLVIFLFVIGAVAQTPPIEPGVSHELAKWRAARYSNVSYKLNLTLEKMSPLLKGSMEIRVNVKSSPPYEGGVDAALGGRGGSLLILDWRKIKGYEDRSTISNVSLNGKVTIFSPRKENHPVGETPTPLLRKEGSPVYWEYNEHLIFRDGVVLGENVIKLKFTSPILASGSAITRYIDKEDGAEYIYSLFVPSDASTAFPVFDQPDLKAKFALRLTTPKDWTAVSNTVVSSSELVEHWAEDKETPNEPNKVTLLNWWTIDVSFPETKPISTYVFAFAAGPFVQVLESEIIPGQKLRHVKPELKAEYRKRSSGEGVSTIFYVRRSQLNKFQPHAAEVFRLNREGIKFLEQYFGYKFPFPKYDLVLIPEFPFGGMEHAGATFLRESAIIFPQEPTRGDHISRANLIFHEAAHQWFGDTVTMKWFDDLWLKEGFAEFMAYKTLERVMPEANAWKVFYERNKQAAYLTDSTRGTTPIYHPIANLNSAKSAYGNIVYRKAPSFLKQAEFYIGPDKFQTAVRAFLKKHEFKNASWPELVKEFEVAGWKTYLQDFANRWIQQRGLPIIKINYFGNMSEYTYRGVSTRSLLSAKHKSKPDDKLSWLMDTKLLVRFGESAFIKRRDKNSIKTIELGIAPSYNPPNYNANNENEELINARESIYDTSEIQLIFPNYQDHGYGIFLLDEKSREYVLKNIHNEKDAFLRSMMWGSLWDSVREGELDPRVFVELAIKNLPTETDETIASSILSRVGTAMNYYLSEGVSSPTVKEGAQQRKSDTAPSLMVGLPTRLEAVLLDRMQNAPTAGERITFFRAFVNNASTEKGREMLKEMLRNQGGNPSSSEGAQRDTRPNSRTLPIGRVSASDTAVPLKAKDKFDIVTRLAVLGDPDAAKLLAELEKAETSDDAKRYAYAARAGFATAENKAKYWNDFVNSKDISESWIEAAFGPWNSIRHNELTLPYLQKALQELPNHKRSRKIFFVNGWLSAFIGGQRSEEALSIVNKFLADNPSLDNDLRLKILENVDLIERAVKIRGKYGR